MTVLNNLKNVGIFIFLLVGVMFFFHMGGLFVSSMPSGTAEFSVVTNTSIHSLHDKAMLRGSFFLGTGTLSDKMYFTYYEGETSFKLKRVPADTTTIFMDEDDHPYIKTITPMKRTVYSDGRATPSSRDYWRETTYEFHVPNGTIVKEYNLNGE
jgi:hypothetical protein